MASSVSSERAFLQGGITITKWHNCLKGDIVEALQCVKCGICHDLHFHELPPSSALETELDSESEDGEGLEAVEDESWDSMLLDDDDDDMADDESDF